MKKIILLLFISVGLWIFKPIYASENDATIEDRVKVLEKFMQTFSNQPLTAHCWNPQDRNAACTSCTAYPTEPACKNWTAECGNPCVCFNYSCSSWDFTWCYDPTKGTEWKNHISCCGIDPCGFSYCSAYPQCTNASGCPSKLPRCTAVPTNENSGYCKCTNYN